MRDDKMKNTKKITRSTKDRKLGRAMLANVQNGHGRGRRNKIQETKNGNKTSPYYKLHSISMVTFFLLI